METNEVLKQASAGELKCPKCGATNMSLKNVRVAMSPDGPKLDPNTYGECGACSARIPIEQLQKMRAGDSTGKSWWQFWK